MLERGGSAAKDTVGSPNDLLLDPPLEVNQRSTQIGSNELFQVIPTGKLTGDKRRCGSFSLILSLLILCPKLSDINSGPFWRVQSRANASTKGEDC